MSDGNVELVRRVLEAFNQRDLEVVIDATDPKVAFFAPTAIVTERRYDLYRGHDGIRTYFDDVERIWQELRLTPREYRHGPQGVVALGTVSGRPRGAHDTVETGVAWAWKLRDGKIVWGRVYTNPEDALGDLGLA